MFEKKLKIDHLVVVVSFITFLFMGFIVLICKFTVETKPQPNVVAVTASAEQIREKTKIGDLKFGDTAWIDWSYVYLDDDDRMWFWEESPIQDEKQSFEEKLQITRYNDGFDVVGYYDDEPPKWEHKSMSKGYVYIPIVGFRYKKSEQALPLSAQVPLEYSTTFVEDMPIGSNGYFHRYNIEVDMTGQFYLRPGHPVDSTGNVEVFRKPDGYHIVLHIDKYFEKFVRHNLEATNLIPVASLKVEHESKEKEAESGADK